MEQPAGQLIILTELDKMELATADQANDKKARLLLVILKGTNAHVYKNVSTDAKNVRVAVVQLFSLSGKDSQLESFCKVRSNQGHRCNRKDGRHNYEPVLNEFSRLVSELLG